MPPLSDIGHTTHTVYNRNRCQDVGRSIGCTRLACCELYRAQLSPVVLVHPYQKKIKNTTEKPFKEDRFTTVTFRILTWLVQQGLLSITNPTHGYRQCQHDRGGCLCANDKR